MAELSLWLDDYDDIYSDFDSRNYAKRRISEDFIYELRNALKYRKERINDLILLLPGEKRNEINEKLIAGNLRDFFTTQLTTSSDKCNYKLKRGIILGIAGIMIIILDAIAGLKVASTLFLTSLRVLLEPAGWFLLWASFDFLFYDWQELKKEREILRELAEMNIHFKAS